MLLSFFPNYRNSGNTQFFCSDKRGSARAQQLGVEFVWVLSSLESIDMVKTFIIIEKQVYKNGSHFGGQISKDSEVFLRRYTSPFRSGFERGQPQDYAANFHSAS